MVDLDIEVAVDVEVHVNVSVNDARQGQRNYAHLPASFRSVFRAPSCVLGGMRTRMQMLPAPALFAFASAFAFRVPSTAGLKFALGSEKWSGRQYESGRRADEQGGESRAQLARGGAAPPR